MVSCFTATELQVNDTIDPQLFNRFQPARFEMFSKFHRETGGDQTFRPIELGSMNTNGWFDKQDAFVIRSRQSKDRAEERDFNGFYLENLIK